MRNGIIHFLEHVADERTMFFVLENMNIDGVFTLFDYLRFSAPEAEERWHHAYAKLFAQHFGLQHEQADGRCMY